MAKDEKQLDPIDEAAKAEAETKPPFEVKTKQQLIVPLLKQQVDKPVYFRITGPFFVGKEIKGSKMEPAHILPVIELISGEPMQLIANAVLRSTLTEAYCNDNPEVAMTDKAGYIGKCFRAVQRKIAGKRYKGYDLAEIEDPAK